MDSESSFDASAGSVDLPSGPFSGPVAFESLVRNALAHAAQEGWREMVFCDADFSDWPLHERSVVESLTTWARSGRHLTLLALRYDEVLRHQARFVRWRQTWGHLVACRVSRAVVGTSFPSAIWSPSWFMQRVDVRADRGVCGQDRERLVRLREALDELLRASSSGFPASVLGL